MQTFLPYGNFLDSVNCLDYRRLGKQRIECKQILRTLLGESKGWVSHPAVKMWRGHETSLALYGICCCTEWSNRGYRDSQRRWFDDVYVKLYRETGASDITPPWLGGEAFHLSHKSNLIRKDPEYYRKLWPDVPDNLPYVWPKPEDYM